MHNSITSLRQIAQVEFIPMSHDHPAHADQRFTETRPAQGLCPKFSASLAAGDSGCAVCPAAPDEARDDDAALGARDESMVGCVWIIARISASLSFRGALSRAGSFAQRDLLVDHPWRRWRSRMTFPSPVTTH